MNLPEKANLEKIYGENSACAARFQNLADNFARIYKHDHADFFTSPGRTEIIGNHVDHNGGKVIAGSINLDTIGAAAPNGTNVIHITSEGYRDEIVTTIFSHPCDAAGPATAGYKVITLMIDPEKGYPSLEDMKAALSERTAAIFITNPEDTGIYNPDIKEYVEAAHEVGAICYYDQANANGMLGIARAKEVGFDAIHYNLHKTFSAPHGGLGPGCGALGVIKDLEPFLPSPRILKEGEKFVLQVNNPQSIGHTRQFFGNSAAVLRAYMWIRTLGAEGVREAAICSVLNNQYLMKKMEQIHGVDIWYAKGKRRLEQCRYSFETLKKETGFGTDDLNHRVMDFGLEEAFLSHHPYIVPEPLTLEPCESCSRDDIDEYVGVYTEMCREAYEEPELLRNAPHNCAIHSLQIKSQG